MKCTLMKTLIILFFVSFTLALNAASIDDFIPYDSFLFVKLNGLDEIPNTIKNNEITGILNVLGTSEILDLFGHSSGLTIWLDKKHSVNAAYIVDTKGDMVLIQRLKKIAPRILGVFATTRKQNAGKHRSIQYSELNLDENKILYGYVDEFFVIGIGERSFKTIINTYKKKSPSILKNERFVEATQKTGDADIFVFSNIATIDNAKKRNALMSFEKVIEELTPFTYISATLNLQEPGEFLKAYAPFTPNALQNIEEILPIQTQMAHTLDSKKTIRTMSGKDDLFIAISPIVTQTLWSLLREYIEQNADGGFYDALSFLESEFNTDFYADVIPALTGEVALSISKFEPFLTPIKKDSILSFQGSLDSDGNSEIEISPIERFGVIFSSINPAKWNEFNNALANAGNTSTKQFFEYGGTTVSQVADSVYLSNINELSIASFGEDDIISLLDTLSANRQLPIDIEHVAQSSIACFQLNLITLLEALLGTEHISNPDDIVSLLAWLSLEENALSLQAAFLENTPALNSLIRFSDTTVNGIISSLKKSKTNANELN